MADKNKQAKVAALKRIGVRTADKGEKPDPTDDTYELTIDGKKYQVPHYVYSMILAGSDDTVSFEPAKDDGPVMVFNDSPGEMGGVSQMGRGQYEDLSKDPAFKKSHYLIPENERAAYTKWDQQQERGDTYEPPTKLDQEIDAEARKPVEIKKYPEIDKILSTARKGK